MKYQLQISCVDGSNIRLDTDNPFMCHGMLKQYDHEGSSIQLITREDKSKSRIENPEAVYETIRVHVKEKEKENKEKNNG